jgi:uncharacterized protein involved in exopolysaccharide biosynthesis
VSDVALHQHWHDVYVRRWLILLTAAAAAIAALVFSQSATPVFEAKTTFYLALSAPQPIYLGPIPDAPAPLFPIPEEKAASLDVGILRGREVRTALAERFGLPYAEVERRVDVTVSGEFMIDVFARGPDPALAANIANAVPEIYGAFHQRSMRSRANEVAVALDGQLTDLAKRRAGIAAALRGSRNESLSTADAAALARIEEARAVAQADVNGLATQIAQTTARRGSLDRSLSAERDVYAGARTVDTTPALDRMLDRVLDLRVDLAAVTDGPNSPRRVAIEQQIAEIEDAMETERRRLADAVTRTPGSLFEELRLERATTEATLAGLEAAQGSAAARLMDAQARFSNVLAASSESGGAATELARIDGEAALAARNLAANRLQAANATPPIVIVEKAVPPVRPIFPLPFLNAAVAALCGLVFGTYYALFVAQSERASQIRRSREAVVPPFTPDEIDRLRLLSA